MLKTCFKNYSKILITLIFVSAFFSLLTLDQGLKHKIRQNGGFYVCNQGISFNIPLSLSLFWLVFIILIGLLFYFLIYLLKNKQISFISFFGFVLFLSGTFSNGLDRFNLGCVVDYIKLSKFNFPLFNLADFFIFLGSCCFFVFLWNNKTSYSA